jgi:hypothetical protein
VKSINILEKTFFGIVAPQWQVTLSLLAFGQGPDLDPKQDPVKISGSRSGKKSGSHWIPIHNTAELHHFYSGSVPGKIDASPARTLPVLQSKPKC